MVYLCSLRINLIIQCVMVTFAYATVFMIFTNLTYIQFFPPMYCYNIPIDHIYIGTELMMLTCTNGCNTTFDTSAVHLCQNIYTTREYPIWWTLLCVLMIPISLSQIFVFGSFIKFFCEYQPPDE